MTRPQNRRFRKLAAFVAVIFGLFAAHAAHAQTFTDDFNDGNDADWTRYNVLQPFGLGATFTFPGGNSYNIDAPGNYSAPQLGGGRAGSIVTSSSSGFNDFRITHDVTDWNDGREYVFGPIARTTTPGLGTTDGYLLILHATDHDFQLLRIEGEAPNSEELGTADIEMPADRNFRIVYSGLGTQLNAMVYDLADLTAPLGGFSVDAANYGPQPTPTPYTTGAVGLIVAQADSASNPPPPPGAPYAATFDNFRVTVPMSGEWNALGGGGTSEAFNWVGNVSPDGVGAHARFLGGAEVDADINIDGVFYTLGKMTFENAHSYTLDGQSLRLQDTGNAEINVLSGSHEIASDVTLGSNLRKIGNGTLTISGAIDWSGNSIEVAGGNLRLAKIQQGNNVNITGGRATLVPGGGTSLVGNVSIAGGNMPTATLDITDNPAVLEYSGASPVATVRAQLLSGRGATGFGATWTGQGITSSTAAAANATEPEARSVGYAENSALPLGAYTNFRGQAVDDTSILMAYTRTGDANLDGVVNDDDVTIVGATYAPGVANPHWALGDFDYNGFVDDDDVTLLGVFYNPAAPPLVAAVPAEAGQIAAVPEPSSVILLASACGAILLVARRRWSRLVPRLCLGTYCREAPSR
jgi:hypothetical protein